MANLEDGHAKDYPLPITDEIFQAIVKASMQSNTFEVKLTTI